jgi:MFS family permease
VALQVLLGAGFAFVSGSAQAMLVDALPEGEGRELRTARMLGWYSAAAQFGFAVSGLLAAWLFPDTGEARYFWPITATSAMWFCGALMVALAYDERQHYAAIQVDRPSALMLLRQGLRLVRADAALRRSALLAIFSDPLMFFWILLYQPVLARSDVPSAWFGPALAIGSVLSTVVTARAADISLRTGLPALILTPALFYAAQAWPQMPVIAVGLFVAQRAFMFMARPVLDARINMHISSAGRATVLSMLALATSGYQALIGIPLGWLAEYSLTALCLALAAVIAASLVFYRTRTGRDPSAF